MRDLVLENIVVNAIGKDMKLKNVQELKKGKRRRK